MNKSQWATGKRFKPLYRFCSDCQGIRKVNIYTKTVERLELEYGVAPEAGWCLKCRADRVSFYIKNDGRGVLRFE